MPEYVGDLAVRIVPDGSGLPAGIAEIMSGVQRQLNATATINTGPAQESVQQLGQSIDTHVNGALTTAVMQAGAFTASFYAAKGMITKVRGELAQLYDPLVKATAGFNAILGQQKGSKLLEDIRQFAKDSPFVTGELVNYSQQLLGVGQSADSIIPLLNSTGDLIASLGGSQQNISRVLFTLTQIRSIGRLAGQDAMQLQSAQIPITKLLSESLKVPLAQVKKLQEQGKISADQVFSALMQAGGKVKGSMDAVTNTIEGARSVLQDTITIMFQNQPVLRMIYDDIVKAIKSVATVLGSDDVTNTVTQFFTNVGKAYQPIKTFFTEFSAASGKLAMTGFKTLTDTLGVFATVLKSIPEGAIKLLAQALAVIATVKAPLMLMKYVQQLQTILGLVKDGTMSRAITNVANGVEAVGVKAGRSNGQLNLLTGSLVRLKNSMQTRWTARQDSYWGMFPEAAVPERIRTRWADQQRMMAAQAAGFDDMSPVPYGPAVPPSAAQAFFLRNQGRIIGGTALAAGIASQYIPGRDTTKAGAAASGALSMGSMGAMAAIGLSSGGIGIAAAAAGGLLVGGITSWIRKSDEMNKAMVEKWKEIGANTAKAWMESQAGVLQGEGQSAIDAYVTKIAELKDRLSMSKIDTARLTDIDLEIEKLNYIRNAIGGFANARAGMMVSYKGKIETLTGNESDTYNQRQKDRAEIVNVRKDRAADQKQLEEVQAAYDKVTMKYTTSVQEVLKTAPELAQFFKQFNDSSLLPFEKLDKLSKYDLAKSFRIDPSKVGDMARWLRGMNIQLSDLTTLGGPVIAELINKFNDMPSAVQAATRAVNDFNTAWQEGSAAKMLDPFEKKAKAVQSAVEAARSLRSALTTVTPENAAGVINQINSAAQMEYALTYQQALDTMKNFPMTEQQKKAAAQGQATDAQNLVLAKSFKELRTQIGGSDEDFKKLMQQLGLYEEYTMAASLATGKNAEALDGYTSHIDKLRNSYGELPKIENGAKASLLKISQVYGVTINDLAKVLQLQGEITPTMQITVTADINDAAAKLAYLKGLADTYGFSSVGALAGGLVPNMGAYVPGIPGLGEPAKISGAIDWYNSMINPKRSGGGGGGGANPLQQAADSIKNAFESGANAIKQAAAAWQTTVKQSIQYDQATSMSTMLRNTRKQTSDLNTLNADLKALKSRGLTEDAINALGITGIKDLKQVQKLMGASDADIAAFSAAVAERNKSATDLAEQRKAEDNKKNMVEAIVAAAKILGYKNLTDAQAAALVGGAPGAATFIDLRTDDPALKKAVDDIVNKIKATKVTRV